MRKRILLFALTAAMASATAVAGAVFEFEITEYGEDPPRKGTMETTTENDATRMEFSFADGRDSSGMIFLGDKGEMIALDHEQKEYVVLDEASMQRMAGEIGNAMRQALEGVPPEQRAMLEEMMKANMPQASSEPATLHATGRSDSVNGYACRSYEVRRSGATMQELCVSAWRDIEGGREASAAIMRMGRFFQEVAQQFSDALGMNVMDDQQQFLAHLEELDGYPVLVREFDEDGELSSEMRLTSAKSTRVDPGVFQPPADYRRGEDLGM